MLEQNQKVTAEHLQRNAYLYVRQSTPRQVLENTESTERQYALRHRAIALGWPESQIITIDSDLGHSGASAADRTGFQHLVSEVGMGRAGIVIGLEVSRLARNCSDWHRLLEICALTNTLILDEDGIYSPDHFNDRLLLGLKGTMSEAELHLLRARMRGGLLNKAKRGELKMYLPVGLTYDAAGRVILEPDVQVQKAVRLVFETFSRTGSALSVVRTFREQGLQFPRHMRSGPQHAELQWKELNYSMLSRILHNPRYAGAFVFGRTRSRKGLDGKGHSATRLPKDKWQVVIHDAHPAYISWEQYEANVARLHDNATACGPANRKGAPREGPALLQGIILCGLCGQRMHPRYVARGKRVWTYYICPRQDTEGGKLKCQHIPGHTIDEAVAALLIESMTPVAVELALSVQQEIQSRIEEADRLRHIQVERARYEVNLAQRRYMQVDPSNRLVASCLETDWNEKLQRLAETQQEYECQRRADAAILNPQQRDRLLALPMDLRKLWQDPNTPQRERKRMVRLLIEDVTVIKNECFLVHVRFKGGTTETITASVPKDACHRRRTSSVVIAEIDQLLTENPPHQIANILNQRGYVTADGRRFTAKIIDAISRHHGLKSRYTRLREAGLLTLPEMASLLGVSTSEAWRRRKQGQLRGRVYGDNKYLYEPISVRNAINPSCEV